MTTRFRAHAVRSVSRLTRLAVLSGVLLLGLTATSGSSHATTTENTWACTAGTTSSSCASAMLAAMPTPRRELSAASASDGRIFVFGGQSVSGGQVNTGGLATVEAYSPNSNTWACSVGDAAGRCGSTTLAPMPTARLETVAMRGADNRLYVFGGLNGSTTFDRVEAYNPTTNSWSCSTGDTACATSARTLAPMPSSRDDMGVSATLDGRLYLIGGENSSGAKLTLVQAYLPGTNSWSTLTPMPIARDDLAAVTVSDGTIYAVGGNNGTSTLAAVESFDPKTNAWTTQAPLTTSRDDLTAVSGPCGRVYAMAGDNNDALLSTTEVYNIATKTWSTVAPIPTSRDDLAGTTGTDGRLYAIGGDDVNSNALGTNEAYTIPSTCGGPTAAHVIRFSATWGAGTVTFRWKASVHEAVTGFWLYAGTQRLTNQIIPAHASPRYVYQTKWSGGGPFTLVTLLTNGQRVRVTAG